MARGINKATLIGNLGQDPEVFETSSGKTVVKMRLATSNSYKKADGEVVENTQWHTVIAWEQLGKICAKLLKKGSFVRFEGSIEYRSYENSDGNNVWVTEIKANEMLLLGNGRDANEQEDTDESEEDSKPAKPARKTATRKTARKKAAPKGKSTKARAEDPDDELPF